ncbi:hypothetical protein BGW80DRAFT_1456840 [Lactifluus volemus]|nr:hypothetical protein BGW80DRAFT_1456840 [Lactifluus volemus]
MKFINTILALSFAALALAAPTPQNGPVGHPGENVKDLLDDLGTILDGVLKGLE